MEKTNISFEQLTKNIENMMHLCNHAGDNAAFSRNMLALASCSLVHVMLHFEADTNQLREEFVNHVTGQIKDMYLNNGLYPKPSIH
jgi:hypothetical protein